MKRACDWALVAAGALAIGSLGPWFHASILGFAVNVNGTRGDGKITLVLAALGAIGALRQRAATEPTITGGLTVLAGVIGAGLGGYDLIHGDNVGKGVVEAAWGLYLVLIASVVMLVAGIRGMNEGVPPTEPAPQKEAP